MSGTGEKQSFLGDIRGSGSCRVINFPVWSEKLWIHRSTLPGTLVFFIRAFNELSLHDHVSRRSSESLLITSTFFFLCGSYDLFLMIEQLWKTGWCSSRCESLQSACLILSLHGMFIQVSLSAPTNLSRKGYGKSGVIQWNRVCYNGIQIKQSQDKPKVALINLNYHLRR